MAAVTALWVLYDDTCGFCCRCADWLSAQDKRLPLTCVPANGPEARAAFAGVKGAGEELVVIDGNGGVYRDTDAWLMTLWALEGWWPWAERLAQPALRPHARGLFRFVSGQRKSLGEALRLQSDAQVQRQLAAEDPSPAVPVCALPR